MAVAPAPKKRRENQPPSEEERIDNYWELFPIKANTVGTDRVLSEVVFTSRVPRDAHGYTESWSGPVIGVTWYWTHGKTTVYALDVRLCGNNIISLRSFDPKALEHWLSHLDEIFKLLETVAYECISPDTPIPKSNGPNW